MKNLNNTHLKIKPFYSVVAHSVNSVELRSGVWNPTSYTLTDETNKGYLLPLILALNGEKSLSEISQELNIPRSELESLIDHLQEISAIETNPSSAIDLYFEQISPNIHATDTYKKNVSPKWPVMLFGDNDLVSDLQKLLVNTLGEDFVSAIDSADSQIDKLENASSDWLYDGLEFEKMTEQFSSWKNNLFVLIQKNINPSLCFKLNRIFHDLKIPWVYAAIDGPFLFIGPTFNQNTACFECFETRISMNVKDHASYLKYKIASANQQVKNSKNFSLDPILRGLLTSHAAMEVTNFSLTGNSYTQNKVLSIYLPTMEINFNEFLRYPNCKTCGVDQLRDSQPLYFDAHKLLDEQK